MKKIFIFVIFAFIASACGGLTQDAPPATKSKAKVSINLPKGVSLKPGGMIESGNPKLHAATITEIILTVTAADITTPITGIIPLATLELTLDVPSGMARTFSVVVKTDMAGSFSGSQTVDLAADAAMDLALSVTVVNSPTAPVGVGVTSGDGQAVLSWTAVTGADTYNVYYGTTAGITTATGTKITGATSGAAITGLTNGTTYYFIVTAVNTSGESTPSAEASATPQVSAPGAPIGVSATSGDGRAVLSWTAVAGAASYNIYYGTAAGVTPSTGTLVAGATSGGAITGLTNGTTHYFIVTAVNAGGESAVSSEVSATPTAPTVSAPSAPTGVSASAGSGQATISWTAVTGAASYNVYYSATAGVSPSNGTPVVGATSGGAITGLVNGTTYYFVVTAVNAGGEGPFSTQVSATPQVPAPSAPPGVSASVGNAQATISWTAITGATSYNVYYRTTAGVTAGNGTKVTGATSGGAITGLTNGQIYYFVVTAVNAGGESAVSSEVSATPLDSAPAAPTGVSASAGNAQAAVSWTYVAGATSYNVYHRTATGVTIANGTKVTGATNGAAVTGLTNGTPYYFVVTAANATGESVISSEVSATPQLFSYNATTAFSTANGNPNGVWSYGWMPTDFSSFNLYTSLLSGGGFSGWGGSIGGDGTPAILKNGGTSISYGVPPGWLTLHPGPQNQPSILRFTAPLSGTVNIDGQFLAGDWGSMQVAVRINGLAQWTAVDSGAFNLTRTVGAGDSIDFAVYGGYGAGNTPIDATITYSSYMAPLTPAGVSATAGNGQATVSWTAVSGATSYNVYYRTATGVTTANGTQVTGATNGGAVTGLTNGTSYYFVVTAVNGTGESVISSEVSATPQVPAPSAPTSPSATAGNGQVTVSWTAPAGTVTSYNVYYGTATGVSTASTKVTGATSGGAITGLTNGTAYYFVITAVNAGGESAVSSEVSATPILPAPAAPAGVTTTASSSSVALSWTAVGTATSYNIYRSTTSGVLGTLIGTSASASYTDTTAVNGTTYYYTITAVNAGGESVAGTAVSAIPLLIMGGGVQNGGLALNNAATASTVAVSTLAGLALTAGTTDATGSAARFGRPYGITTDGTYLFVADQTNNTIRKIVISTGVVTTLAGSGVAASTDGTGTVASFNSPTGITTDGTNLFVTDRLGHAIRKIVISTGVVTTVAGSGVAGAADGTGTAASFNNPNGIVTDGANLYIADQVNGSVRKIVISTGVVTTFATGFTAPRGITTDGTNLYVANSGGNIIQKIVISTGTVTTLAGSGVAGSADGTGTAATFKLPLGITTDGTNLYVVDNNNYTIRQIVISTGVVSTIAGAALTVGSTDGIGSAARFKFPNGITTDGSNLFVADGDNFTIRKIVPLMGGAVPKQLNSSGVVTTFAGAALTTGSTDATGTAARFYLPYGITTDGTNLYVADTGNQTIRQVVIATGVVTTLAGTALATGSTDATGAAARFFNPYGITTDGTNLYVTEYTNHTIRQVVIATGVVTTLAGSAGLTGSVDGTGVAARFLNPWGITTDGTNLYVADSNNNTIRKVVIATGVVTTLAGSAGLTGSTDATGTLARFNAPQGITTDGTSLYVADFNAPTIRKIVISTGVVTTLAGTAGNWDVLDGTGAAASFYGPIGITTDGTNLYVTDYWNNNIRKIVIATTDVTTLAGDTTMNQGATDGTGTAARFKQPYGITTDGTSLYVADSWNYTIRKIQ